MKMFTKKGFTLVELLMVLGICRVLLAISTPIYLNWQTASQINEISAEIIQTIRLAKIRSEANFNNMGHGVYFNCNEVGTNSLVLYQGDSYATREQAYDRIIIISEIMSVNLNFGNNDINFSRGLGVPNVYGQITVNHKITNESVNIELNSLGIIE